MLSLRNWDATCVEPESRQIVQIPCVFRENVHHDIEKIDQYPLPFTFDTQWSVTLFRQGTFHSFGDVPAMSAQVSR